MTQIPSSQAEQIKGSFLEEVAFEVGLGGSAGFFQTRQTTDRCVQIIGPTAANMEPWPCQEFHIQRLILKAALESPDLLELLSR